jgi:lysophospholipase L1-like esterase
MLKRTVALAFAAVLAVVLSACGSSPYPSSMASAGDSITRAFDIDALHVLRDSPQYSWSTGNSTAVNSEYRRLLALNSGISGHAYNDAASGAKMVALDGQLQAAARQNVDYATVLMGANDLCTDSAATMTSVDAFRTQFSTALSRFTRANPDAKVFVSSIPNIYQLWSVLHTNATARAVWGTFGICQSMLGARNTEAQRQLVVSRELAFNNVLASICAQHNQCRYDGGATYRYSFPTSAVSTVDYFHPNLAGQNALAAAAWRAGFWG